MKSISLLIAAMVLWNCQSKQQDANQVVNISESKDRNPAAEGFNFANSDQEAIDLADQVMTAMGGREAWDNTRYISWNFFGSRKLLWDKWKGDVRIDFLKTDLKILVNINDLSGKVKKEGKEITQTDSVDFYLKRGKSIWINDSYWLVMPFKLKDSGVTLEYIGADTTEFGTQCDVLQLSFESVGDTPENLYKVWIDKESSLVTQWAFFDSKKVIDPDFITPWSNYQKYGTIMLSGNRGKGQLTEIEVLESVADSVFIEL